MIKEIKIGNLVYNNISKESEDNLLPTDLEEFKKVAIDTINWQIGNGVKRAVGNTDVNLSAANAKAIVLLTKVMNTLNPSLDGLSNLEKDSYDKMTTLAGGGYADSELLNGSLGSVSELIAKSSDKVARVTSSTSIDEVITILNEE